VPGVLVRPPCTVLSLQGSEEQARAAIQPELERIARDLERDEPAAAGTARAYTVYLLPSGEEWNPATLADDIIPIQFPWDDDTLLALTMRREMDDLYATGGMAAAERLLGSANYSDRMHCSVDWSAQTPDEGIYPNASRFADWQEARRAGNLVAVACGEALRDLRRRVRTAVAEVQARAAAIGLDRLRVARSEVEAEAARYLDTGDAGGRASGRRIVEGDGPAVWALLRGPDVAALVAALRAIEPRRAALEAVADDYGEKERDIVRNRAGEVSSLGGPRFASSTGAPVSPQEMDYRYPGATGALEDASTALALAVLVQCRAHPVLCRTWREHRLPPGIDAIATPRGPQVVGTTLAAAEAVARLRDGLLATFRTTWTANAALADLLRDDAATVWHYPPLIQAALDALGHDDRSLHAQAARERLAEEDAMSVAGVLGMVNGALMVGASIAGAAPPVELALAAASLLLGAIDTVQQYLKTREQDRAYRATLDPSKALASEPDYLGLVVGVAFTLLDVKGVRDAVRVGLAARAASTAVEAAAR
jgi:hypothetical protein